MTKSFSSLINALRKKVMIITTIWFDRFCALPNIGKRIKKERRKEPRPYSMSIFNELSKGPKEIGEFNLLVFLV